MALSLSDISKHLSEDVINTVFKLRTKSQERVKEINISRAAPPGMGLLGAVYRVKVQGINETMTFIAKGMVKDPLLKRTLQTAKYFEREVIFFSKVLPAMKEMQKKMGGKERLQNNMPICYACHCDGENDYILLEDLAETFCSEVSSNPTLVERDGILNTLAHLHAVSFAWKLKNPEDFAKITNGMHEVYYSEENRSYYAAYLQNAIKIDLKTLGEFEDTNSIYFKKFAKLVTDDPYGTMMKLLSDRSRKATICHGDAWAPNFLHSNTRTVALDFQILRYASPLTDVSYFITLCSQQCCNKTGSLKAYKMYHESLTYYLNDMGIDVNDFFSWEDLCSDLKIFGKFGVLAAVTSFPLLASERCDVLENFDEKYKGVDKIPLEELWPLTPFKTEQEKLVLVKAVRIAVDMGLI